MNFSRIAAVSVIACAALTAAACEKEAPDAAKKNLSEGLNDLVAKNKAGFIAQVVPSQRKSFKLAESMQIGDKTYSTMPMDKLLDIKMFSTIKSYKYDKSTLKSDNKAEVLTVLTFEDGAFATLFFKMDKLAQGDWKINMKETVDWHRKVHGSFAFTAVKLKKR